jgi:hypothetical protein
MSQIVRCLWRRAILQRLRGHRICPHNDKRTTPLLYPLPFLLARGKRFVLLFYRVVRGLSSAQHGFLFSSRLPQRGSGGSIAPRPGLAVRKQEK